MVKPEPRRQSTFPAGRLAIAAAVLVSLSIALYGVWFASGGRLPILPQLGKVNYYTDLGEAFLHGQVALLEKPDRQLVALPNPYSFAQRQQVPFEFDYSYYKGEYYLYWGPVPGLILAGVEAATGRRPANSLLPVLCYAGLSFLLLAVLAQIRGRFFSAAPRLSLILFLLSGLVSIPMLFLIGRTEVYETSIIAGQLFLFLGLAGWMAYAQSGRAAWLLAAGGGWGLALGSRYDLGVSILLLAGFGSLWIAQRAGWRHAWKALALLAAPMVICVLGLGWYNLARFGDPLQTGLVYQLTVPVRHYFLPSYLPTNAYAYLLSPATFEASFPFIQSSVFTDRSFPPWLAFSISSGQQFDPVMMGLLFAAPVLWLLALVVPLAPARRGAAPAGRLAFFAVISGAAGVQAVALLLYYYGAMRFVADFYLLLVLVAAMLAWRTDELLQRHARLRIFFWVLVAGLALWTAFTGYFGAFDIPPDLFRHYSPSLYTHLAADWNRAYQALRGLLDALGIPRLLRSWLHLAAISSRRWS